MIGNSAALMAAICWAIGGLISVTPARQLGPIGFNRIRMPLAFIMLSIMACFTGGWSNIDYSQLGYIFFSSVIGIFLGDSALFYTMNKMGPRRTGMLFAANAPMAAGISFLVFGETLSLWQLAGCVTVLLGVLLAIVFGTTANQNHHWEQVTGSVTVGFLMGLFAAFCQASSAIIIKPVMASGADPVAISALRVGISSLCILGYSSLNRKKIIQYSKLTPGLVVRIACCGFVGMGLAMTFLLFGLSKGEAGIIITLSATTPVMMLPLLWFKTGERPAMGSWCGAILTVIGSGMLFNASRVFQ